MRNFAVLLGMTLASMSGTLMGVAAEARAQTKVQMSAAVGDCLPESGRLWVHEDRFIVPTGANRETLFICSIDAVLAPAGDLTQAVAYLEMTSGEEDAWAQICLRSVISGALTCGKQYSPAPTGGGRYTITALPPSLQTVGDYIITLHVFLPGPSEPGYQWFSGFHVEAN